MNKKRFNPYEGVKMVPFEKELVQFANHIIDERIRLGRPVDITNENDWGLVDFIIRGWEALYPEYSNGFFEHMKKVHVEANPMGVSKEKGGAVIQHLTEIPQSLNALLMIAFPNLKWTKKFAIKFTTRYRLFRGAEKI